MLCKFNKIPFFGSIYCSFHIYNIISLSTDMPLVCQTIFGENFIITFYFLLKLSWYLSKFLRTQKRNFSLYTVWRVGPMVRSLDSGSGGSSRGGSTPRLGTKIFIGFCSVSQPHEVGAGGLLIKAQHRVTKTGNRHNDGSTICYYLVKVTKSQGINFAKACFQHNY